MEILYKDADIVVAIKPPRVLSTDEPGGMPSLLRQALSATDIRTVHRLDAVVSGVMVFARNGRAASELSRQVREGEFQKAYLAVVHGVLPKQHDTLRDLLLRDKMQRKTFVVTEPGKDVQEAVLSYETVAVKDDLSRVEIQLQTGRTHQIRVQFSSRGFPLVGDRKYSVLEDGCEIALWSYRLAFAHPVTGEKLTFSAQPPQAYPWDIVG